MDEMHGAVQALQIYAADPQTAKAVGAFTKEYFGGIGHNIVGLFGGDWLYHKRLENIARIAHGVQERLEADGISAPTHVTLALGLPLLKAAADEDRDELIELWERLLAAAMTPGNARPVRQRYIAIIKSLDPTDAVLFKAITKNEAREEAAVPKYTSELGISSDEVEISMQHLESCGLVKMHEKYINAGGTSRRAETVYLTPLGREFKRTLGL